ncbi:MAG: DUF222 domain-containing protein [Deltaproteobacteria bacterium]|nr:DUF222 domain-containing protein [Deltaproteobacteria bacterium]
MSEETIALDLEIASLAAQLAAVTHKLLVKIREFDQHDGYAPLGYLSMAHYLSFRIGMSLAAAHEKVRVAHALVGLPIIDAAFALGALSYSKVRALTRIATPEKEEQLLAIANDVSAAALERIVRGVRRVGRIESAEKREEARGLHCFFDDDGMFVMQGRFLADEGAMIMKMLEGVPLPKERMAAGKRNADALVHVAAQTLSGAEGTSADRMQVVVHVDQEVLTDDAPDGRADIAGVHSSAEECRRIACDASVITMTHDKDGNTVDTGRKTRVISTPLKRKLKERDGTCRFPGCTNTLTDGHHVEHWSKGGATTLENLVSLCRRHHRFVHEHGYCVKRDERGLIVFIDPRGQEIANTPPPLPAVTCVPPAAHEMPMPRYAVIEDFHYVVNSLIDSSAEESRTPNTPRFGCSVRMPQRKRS